MPAPSPKTKSKYKVFLVDDHAILREGLRYILEQEKDLAVCGDAADASEALEKIKRLRPDLVISEIFLKGSSGLDLVKTLRAQFPQLRLLILSTYKEHLYAERSLRSGAHGYVMKRDGGKILLEAIRHILKGQTHISEEFNQKLLQTMTHAGQKSLYSMDLLSNRELDVLRLIGQGYGSRQIAESLTISVKTVEAHREHIRAKLNMSTNSDLVQHAIHWVHSENTVA